MTFLELARERYSVRKFDSRPIEEEKLNAILEAGRLAPTAVNKQPQHIYVLRSEEALAKIREITPCHYGAPVVLAVAYDEEKAWHNQMMPGYHSGKVDASIVCTHMMMEAWDLGIGSCWVGMFTDEKMHAAFDLPATEHVCALLPLGYALAEPGPQHTASKTVDELVTVL